MPSQKNNGGSPDIIPFARPAADANRSMDQLDQVGQAIVEIVGRAADIAEGNNQQAMDSAHKLSHELRAAQDRIGQLTAEAASLQERADHAEGWLHKVYTEIEDRFLNQKTRQAASRS